MNSIKRLVLNFPGFEATTSIHQIERLSAGGYKTAALWGFELEAAAISQSTNGIKAETSFISKSDAWVADTRYVHLSWSDIISKYENVPFPNNLIRHLFPYLAFFADGTIVKYFKTSRRYWGFTIYPLLLIMIFAIIPYPRSPFVETSPTQPLVFADASPLVTTRESRSADLHPLWLEHVTQGGGRR